LRSARPDFRLRLGDPSHNMPDGHAISVCQLRQMEPRGQPERLRDPHRRTADMDRNDGHARPRHYGSAQGITAYRGSVGLRLYLLEFSHMRRMRPCPRNC